VPELFFLNCCHVGAIGQGQGNRLAVGLAEQLIRIGVRAVVAAGWPVDDAAATSLAEVLYHAMVAEPRAGFGEAVRLAREKVFAGFGGITNTWGAYQCYGDPEFALRSPAGAVATSAPRFVSRGEAIQWLRDFASRLSDLSSPDVADALARLRTVEATVPVCWRCGRFLAEIGSAYGDLGAFDEAVDRYSTALKTARGQEEVPLRLIEQLGNLLARRAGGRYSAAATDADRKAAAADNNRDLTEAFTHLHRALDVARTPERLALLGSCLKRAALISAGKRRRRYLSAAADAYEEALDQDRAHADDGVNHYYALNQVACRALLAPDPPDPDDRRAWRALIADARRFANLKEQATGDFFHRVAGVEADILDVIVQGPSEHLDVARCVAAYETAMGTRSTRRQRRSVCEQMAFLVEMLEWRSRRTQASELRQVCDALAA